VQVAQKENALAAVSELARRVRKDLGEPPESLRRFDVSLDKNTSSLEALRAYAAGLNILEGRTPVQSAGGMPKPVSSADEVDEKCGRAAVPYFQQSAHWDPNFALAYSALAKSYDLIGWHALYGE